MRRKTAILSIFVAFAAIALTACAERKKISEITGDPGRYVDREVTIVGKVTNAYGALNYGAYEIDDGTGRMWVVTEKYGVPSKGTFVGVSGKIVPGVTYEGRNYGTGMYENARRTRPSR